MTSAVYKRPWAVLAGLAVIIFIVFSPCVRLGFINFDDDTHLVNNPATGKWGAASFQLMWSQPVQRVYIPLTTLSFAIERNLVGLNPWLYHLDNVLLHIANSLLVAIIALRLNLPLGAAIFAGAIFGLHPMRVESVAWVTERKDVLCAFFYLLACYQWLKYRATLERRSWVFVHVFCALSLLAKPMAISLPFALLGLDWYMRRRINAAAFKDKMGILILCLALGWVTYQWHIRNPIDDAFKAMQLWVSSAVFYWQKFFIPFGLNPIYPIPTGNQLLLRFLVSALVLVAIFWSLWRWRGERLWALAVAFYACSIFFILRLDDRSDIHWVADRFMYIPSIALCWWLGNVFYRYWRWGVLVVFGLGVLAFQQIPVWKDSVSLWSYVLAHSPDEPLAYNNRADAYIDLKQPQKAIDDYTYLIGLLERMPSRNIISRISDGHGGETVMVKPWHLNAVEVKFNRALAYDEAGHFDKAVADFDDVIQHYPNYDAAYYRRGVSQEGRGDYQAAVADYAQCLSLNPQHSECHASRGNLYNKMGRWYDALVDYNRAIKINPGAGRVYSNRAIVYLALELPDKALADFNEAIRLEPTYGGAYFNRSVYYYGRKNYRQAMDDVLEASRLGVLIPDKYYQDLKSSLQ